MADRQDTMLLSALCLLLIVSTSAFVTDLDDSFWESKDPEDIWLIKFYSPRCLLCRQLAPVWHHIGSELRSVGSPVHVGQTDASINTALAKEFKVRGYPTIFMLKKEMKYVYSGPRAKDAILDFAHRVGGPLVRSLSSLQLFQHAMTHRDVLFVYIGGTSPLKGNYTTAAEELIVHTYFFSAPREALPKAVSLPALPAVMVFKDGTYFTYNEHSDGDLKAWINRERFPNYFKIDSYTLYSMGDSDKLVLLALVQTHCEESLRLKGLVEKVAAEYREQYSRNFHFGFMEDTAYIKGLVMGDVLVPSIIMLNLSTDGYFLPPVAMETDRQLMAFMDQVLQGDMECQGGNGWQQMVKRFIYDVTVTINSLYTDEPILGMFLLSFPVSVATMFVYFCYFKKRPITGEEDDDDDDDDEDALTALANRCYRKQLAESKKKDE